MNAWFDWQVTVPQPVQDYIAAGTVLGLSLGRSNINNDVQQPGWSLTEHIINTAGLMLIGWLVCIFIWPIYLFTLPFFWLVWFATRSSSHPAERGHIVALLPLLYLALATLLNLWL